MAFFLSSSAGFLESVSVFSLSLVFLFLVLDVRFGQVLVCLCQFLSVGVSLFLVFLCLLLSVDFGVTLSRCLLPLIAATCYAPSPVVMINEWSERGTKLACSWPISFAAVIRGEENSVELWVFTRT